MKKYIFLIPIVIFFYSCECEVTSLIEPTEVNPFIAQIESTSDDVVIRFSDHIDPSSVVLNSTFIVEGPNLTSSITYEIEPQTDYDNLRIFRCGLECGTGPLCDVKITFLGEGSNVIKSVNGTTLDGNMDGTDGGNFEQDISFSTCTVLGNSFTVADIFSTSDEVVIAFNKKLDQSSIASNVSVYIEGTYLLNVPDFTIEEQATFDNIVIPLCNFDCGNETVCNINIYLSGDPTIGIRSIDGQLLDGDQDGNDGGDFSANNDIDICTNVGGTFVVVEPGLNTLQVYQDDYPNNYIETSLLFNEPVDPGLFIPNETVLMFDASGNPYTDFTSPSWAPDFLSCSFVIHFQEELQILDLVIRGTNPSGGSGGVVVNQSGEPLDGDQNGLPGGDYSVQYQYDLIPQVYYPDPSIDSMMFGVEGTSGKFFVDIDFNTDIDPASVIANESIVLGHENFGPYTIIPTSIVWFSPSSLRVLTDDVDIDVLTNNCNTSNCSFTLRVRGTDNSGNPLISASFDGQLLDGDFDGVPGGDYIANFWYPY